MFVNFIFSVCLFRIDLCYIVFGFFVVDYVFIEIKYVFFYWRSKYKICFECIVFII